MMFLYLFEMFCIPVTVGYRYRCVAHIMFSMTTSFFMSQTVNAP